MALILFTTWCKPGLADVQLLERRERGSVRVLVQNTNLAELTVMVHYRLTNASAGASLPRELVCSPGETREVVVLQRLDPSRPWNWAGSYQFTWGTPEARHSPAGPYLLPYAPGQAFRVVQGNNGSFSHQGENLFAIDFGMPEGTPVHAAREGTVVLVRDDFVAGGKDASLKDRGNTLFIRHADATIAEYGHLAWHGVRVRLGDQVQAGQWIALSGNTGYSSGPHLHFMVFRARNARARASLPIRFLTQEGAGLTLSLGRSYTAISGPRTPSPPAAPAAGRAR